MNKRFIDLSQLGDGLIDVIIEITLLGGDTDITKNMLMGYKYVPSGTKQSDSLMMKNYTHYSVTYKKHHTNDDYNLMAIARHQEEYNV